MVLSDYFFQIKYHELETFNGDSSSIIVQEARFSVDDLQPGRNYSIAVSAVSNGIESVASTLYQATSKYTSLKQGSRDYFYLRLSEDRSEIIRDYRNLPYSTSL